MGQNRFHIQSTHFPQRYGGSSEREGGPSVNSTGMSRHRCKKKQCSAVLVCSRESKTIELEEENMGEALRLWSRQSSYTQLWLWMSHLCWPLPSANTGCVVSAKILDFCVMRKMPSPGLAWISTLPNSKVSFSFPYPLQTYIFLKTKRKKPRLSQHRTALSLGPRW